MSLICFKILSPAFSGQRLTPVKQAPRAISRQKLIKSLFLPLNLGIRRKLKASREVLSKRISYSSGIRPPHVESKTGEKLHKHRAATAKLHQPIRALQVHLHQQHLVSSKISAYWHHQVDIPRRRYRRRFKHQKTHHIIEIYRFVSSFPTEVCFARFTFQIIAKYRAAFTGRNPL